MVADIVAQQVSFAHRAGALHGRLVSPHAMMRLRGGRQGATAPPAPPARDYVPWNPDSLPAYAKRLACMPLGRVEQAVHDPDFDTSEACVDALILSYDHLQGVWGRAAPPVGSARGGAASHPQAACSARGGSCSQPWQSVKHPHRGARGAK